MSNFYSSNWSEGFNSVEQLYEIKSNSENPFEGILNSDQCEYVENVLDSYGLQGVEHLNQEAINGLVRMTDERISAANPDLKAKLNYSHFGQESEVWQRFREHLEPKLLEAPIDKVQVEQIGRTLANLEDVKFENWRNYDIDAQIRILNSLERSIANIEHRPASTIVAEKMEEDLNGYQTGDKIAINIDNLKASKVDPEILDSLLETLVHEGRHRYQDYNIYEREVHSSHAQVEMWRENAQVYEGGDPVRIKLGPLTYTNDGLRKIGARLYYYQPLETDARAFAADAMEMYHKYASQA